MRSSALRTKLTVLLAAIMLLLLSCGVTYSTYITLRPEKPEGATPASLGLARRVLQERYNQALEGKAQVKTQEGMLQVALSREGDSPEAIALAGPASSYYLNPVSPSRAERQCRRMPWRFFQTRISPMRARCAFPILLNIGS